MKILKTIGIILLIPLLFFTVTFTIYFFNLDMKLVNALFDPLTRWYDWSKERRDRKKNQDPGQK